MLQISSPILLLSNLPAKDVDGGAPDTYINVYYTPSATAPYQLLGRTKAVADSKGPEFAEIYEIPEGGESDEVRTSNSLCLISAVRDLILNV